jgi:hypothetical protein
MDVPPVIRQRLADLGVEQWELPMIAQVTESYISQLLTHKKAPCRTGQVVMIRWDIFRTAAW